MTVADNTSRNQYTATNLQVSFAYTFEIVDKDDIVVLKNGTTLSEGADYLVFNVGNDNGGTIELTAGATAGDILTLYRDMPYARTQNYTNSGDFLASEVNSDFDELWLASEQTNRSFEQSVRKPITDSDTISMELPEASSRANKLLGFDATGAVSTSLVTDDAQTIAGIAADIETLAHIQDGTVATDAITNVNTIRTDVTAVSGVASDVTAVAGNTANINTVATDLTGADDIGTVAGSITNVNTVAGDIANVNSVAGNATNINTVAADLSGADDIGTVAGSISSVNTVAPDINHVVTVSGDLAGADNIGTVATNISNVNAVGGISSDVTTVAGISTEVTAVSSNSANINTVGTNITNVNNVGSNIANVNTVAGLETEINAVVADEADIGVVGANITSVNTVSSNINSVNAVYNNMADVNNAAANATAAAASAADANTSAGAAATSASAASTSASNASSSESAALTSANNASQSAATASLSASAAATSATNASSSAANAATSESNADNSETAAAISASNASSSASTASNNAIAAASSATSASNSASQAASSASAAATSASNSETAADTWNSYYSTYLGASATAPSYDLLGQPLQNGALYFNTTDDTMYVFNGSIWIAAESTINIVSVPTQLAADLTTNGNDIIFGDNDKAIFGAGSDLQIYHDGTHSYIKDAGTGNFIIEAADYTILRGTNSNLLFAARSGQGITGYYNGSAKLSTTSTGIDVTGTIKASGNGKLQIADDTEGSTFEFNVGGSGALEIYDGSTERMRIDANGNVGFGTQTITNSTGYQRTSINGSNGGILEIKSSDTPVARFLATSGSGQLATLTAIPLLFTTNGSERIRIDANGNVGIGTSSPATKLEVANTSAGVDLALRSSTTGTASLYFGDSNSIIQGRVAYNNSNNSLAFTTAASERMRITSSGNVGIGTTVPQHNLDVVSLSSASASARIEGGSNLDASLFLTEAGNSGFKFTYDGGDNKLYIGSGTSGTFTTRMTLERDSGNVGIGTTSPLQKLVVDGGSGNSIVRIQGDSVLRIDFGASTDPDAGRIEYDSTGNSMRFYANNSEAARITSSGSLGIGTSSPTQPLHITKTDAIVRLDGTASARVQFMESDTTDKNFDLVLNNGSFLLNEVTDAGGFVSTPFKIEGGAGNNALVVNSSGNVGIGTSSPGGLLAAHTGTDSSDILALSGGNSGRYLKVQSFASGAGFSLDATSSEGVIALKTVGTERMRITNSGNLLVGCTALPTGSASGFGFTADQLFTATTSTSANTQVRFYNGNGLVGNITTDGSATAYNTSSDQRLKDNIVDAPSASDDIDAIQVRSFDWKADGSHQKYGMVAQELQSVAPDAVTEGDTEEDMMSIDYSKLVPMLVKEIQTLRARVAQLETN